MQVTEVDSVVVEAVTEEAAEVVMAAAVVETGEVHAEEGKSSVTLD